MTRDHANRLLDQAKAGEYVSPRAITEALHATGDMKQAPMLPSSGREPGWVPGVRVAQAERRLLRVRQ